MSAGATKQHPPRDSSPRGGCCLSVDNTFYDTVIKSVKWRSEDKRYTKQIMPLPETQPRLPKVLARDQVYDQLRRWLVEGVLKPGEKLNYYDIGKRLGFSSIPIREACLRLHYEGFIEMAHSRWTRVVPLDVNKAAEVCLAIEALELLAFELATPLLKASDIRQLRVLSESLRGALENGETYEAALADRAFHQIWIDRSANQKVADLLADLKDRLQIAESVLFSIETHTPIALIEHDTIAEALARGETAKTTQVLREHWRTRTDRLRKLTAAEHK